jgi:hypothetical protein
MVVTDAEPERLAPLPRQRQWASAGFGWWRRDGAPTRLRGVLACPRASVRAPPWRGLLPKGGRPRPAARSRAITQCARIPSSGVPPERRIEFRAVTAFEARRDVDAVAEEVVFVDQDVAEIDADAIHIIAAHHKEQGGAAQATAISVL